MVKTPQILIVEDEVIIARDLQNKLERLGYVVPDICTSGDEAIEKAESTHPDLVLMDIRLEGNVDGVEAAEYIYTRLNVPVVYLTAYADEETFQRAKTTGAFGYILKPFNERGLQTAIELALHKCRMESRLRRSAEQSAAILRSLSDAVIMTDADTVVTFMNPVAEALTGWKQEDALGKELREVLDIESEETSVPARSSVEKALRKDVVVNLEKHTLATDKDGTRTPIHERAVPIRDDKGNISGAVLVFRTLTERKRLKETLRASAQKYSAVVQSDKVRRGIPVFLTEEEMEKLKMQPKLEEIMYLKKLRRSERQGAGSPKRLKGQIFTTRRNNAIIYLLYSSGIRLVELVNLDLADIELEKKQLKVRAKSSNERYCFLTPEMARVLKRYIEARGARDNAQDEALFITIAGERIRTRDIQRIIPRYANQAGINKKVTPHILRHSIAIHLLDRGMDLQYVQAFLKHASASSTQIYTQVVSNKRLRQKLSSHHPDIL